jgi:hypothetical protein
VNGASSLILLLANAGELDALRQLELELSVISRVLDSDSSGRKHIVMNALFGEEEDIEG